MHCTGKDSARREYWQFKLNEFARVTVRTVTQLPKLTKVKSKTPTQNPLSPFLLSEGVVGIMSSRFATHRARSSEPSSDNKKPVVNNTQDWLTKHERYIPWAIALLAGFTRFYRLDRPDGKSIQLFFGGSPCPINRIRVCIHQASPSTRHTSEASQRITWLGSTTLTCEGMCRCIASIC
jgi:hypothetical protein